VTLHHVTYYCCWCAKPLWPGVPERRSDEQYREEEALLRSVRQRLN
jgi:hypothetical protein